MLMEQARNDIVTYGNRMITEGLTQGTSGNISIYDPETKLMAISPSGVPYADTTPEDVVIMDLQGNIVEGTCKPSSEHALHSAFYLNRPDAQAVVHAHSMYCTTLACLGTTLKSVHYAIADAMSAEIPLAPYHTYGTPDLANAVAETLRAEKSRGLLLANHGMLAYGNSIKSAFGLALTMEWCAELQWRCMSVGTPNILSDGEMDIVMEHFKTYGQKKTDGSHPTGYNG